MYSVWLRHHCSASVSDSWSDMVSMFGQVSGLASHVHNSIHCTLCSQHEQRLLHELLTHLHFTGCKTDCGARGTLVRTGISSPFASCDHPRVVGCWQQVHVVIHDTADVLIHCSLAVSQFPNLTSTFGTETIIVPVIQ